MDGAPHGDPPAHEAADAAPETTGEQGSGSDVFAVGDRVQLTDNKGRIHTITLVAGATFHSHKGAVAHDALIGSAQGVVATSTGGMTYLALRPILEDYVLSMGRKAAIIYPKDAFAIVGLAGLQPGSRVIEAGAGSGALTCFLLNAVGPGGCLHSFEQRPDFADVARRNVARWFSDQPDNWTLHVGPLQGLLANEGEHPGGRSTGRALAGWADALVLDMLAPWDCVETAAHVLRPGGRLVVYVATTTQLSRVVEQIRADERFTEPRSSESMVRTWHLEGLAVRPDHRMVGHTAFLVVCRRLAPGHTLPPRRSRPAIGAYGEDYHGPRPPGLITEPS